MSQSTGHPNSTIGPMVRLRGLPYSALPLGGIGIHPDGTEEKLNTNTQIHPTRGAEAFITDVLRESSLFIDGMGLDDSWDLDKRSTTLFGKKRILFLKRVIPARDINRRRVYSQLPLVDNKEVWYARRSFHDNQDTRGSATWDQVTVDIKENHALTEEAVSDDVTAKQCMRWNTNNLIVDSGGEQWNNITMAVVEMRHKMPVIINKRTFPVVLITASPGSSNGNEFLVISIPIIDFETTTWAQLSKEKKQVVAAYAAIEQFRILPQGEIEWTMATTVRILGKDSVVLYHLLTCV